MELLLLFPLSGAPSNFSEKRGLCSRGEGWLCPAGFGWCAPSPEIPLQSHNWGGKAGPWPPGCFTWSHCWARLCAPSTFMSNQTTRILRLKLPFCPAGHLKALPSARGLKNSQHHLGTCLPPGPPVWGVVTALCLWTPLAAS